MAWTAYHDQLQQEAIALMTEPEWYNQTMIQRRLYGGDGAYYALNPTPDSIIGQLGQAGKDLGKTPKLDAQGEIVRDGSGAIQYMDGDERLATLMSQFEKARLQAESANETRYGELLSGYQNRADSIVGGVQRDGQGNITGGVPTYQSVGQQYGQGLDSVTSGYQTREADVMSNFNQYGQQARQDMRNNYTQQRATADQGMTDRGMGNTTMRSSVLGGVNSREQQDLGRFDQDLSRQRADMLGSLRGDTLGAQTAATQGKAQFGTTQLGAMADLFGEPLGVKERRTDTGPSLADIANLSAQAGRGSANQYALTGLQALTSYQPKSSGGTGSMFG